MENDTPEYAEAYPTLRIEDVLGRGHGNPAWINWFGRETIFKAAVGSAEFKWQDGEHFEISYQFEPLYGQPYTGGREKIYVRYRKVGGHMDRASLLCPIKGELVQHLYFRLNDWGCRSCQGLHSRSSRLPRRPRMAEQCKLLRLELKDGRPPGMHMRTFVKKVHKLRYLTDQVEQSARRYCQTNQHLVSLHENGRAAATAFGER